jgi:hypothetical protein
MGRIAADDSLAGVRVLILTTFEVDEYVFEALSPLTVKTHVNHAMTKFGARDRAQLVVLAYQTGLARAPRPRP